MSVVQVQDEEMGGRGDKERERERERGKRWNQMHQTVSTQLTRVNGVYRLQIMSCVQQTYSRERSGRGLSCTIVSSRR